ncbi:MAG: hypothetical protein ACREUF_08705, partial [Solimonas sp.]
MAQRLRDCAWHSVWKVCRHEGLAGPLMTISRSLVVLLSLVTGGTPVLAQTSLQGPDRCVVQ